MKHKPIFRLSLLALLLAGCGKDTTELPEGPETPATGGDAIVCRLSIGNEAPDPTDETRTAYGPLQDGYYPIYWRNADRVGIICPQTTPQRAEVEVSVSGAGMWFTMVSKRGPISTSGSSILNFAKPALAEA